MKEHSSHDDIQVSLSKRRLLRGAATAAPAIMTLKSGAALAAASSLLAETGVGTNTFDVQSPAGDQFDLVCLDNPPSDWVMVDGKKKYRQPIDGCLVPQDTYTRQSDGTPDLTAVEVCVESSTEEFQGTMHDLNGQGGLLVSAMAFSSISPILNPCEFL